MNIGKIVIDYGYLKSNNLSTLQAVMNNKKISMQDLFNNLGKADITSLVNFNLLKEYFEQNKLKVKKPEMLEKKSITKLIVHCSDTPNELDLRASDIHKMHIGFGWNGIGYHKVILRSGIIENGRPEFWIGAHVKGLNSISLGVCLIGSKKFTKIQFISLKKVLLNWKKKYPNAKILGHRDSTVTTKTCPNFDVVKWCKENLN